jgi:hypothetical protein
MLSMLSAAAVTQLVLDPYPSSKAVPLELVPLPWPGCAGWSSRGNRWWAFNPPPPYGSPPAHGVRLRSERSERGSDPSAGGLHAVVGNSNTQLLYQPGTHPTPNRVRLGP